jgi:hypothetical protein
MQRRGAAGDRYCMLHADEARKGSLNLGGFGPHREPIGRRDLDNRGHSGVVYVLPSIG